MKIYRFLIVSALIIFLLFTPLHKLSAQASVSGSRRNILGEGTDYTAILYDSANGLPTSEANALVQTNDGFIWIGGYSGLIRYDGTSFTRFDSSIGISSVFSLYADSKDRLWIGTNENGVAMHSKGEFKIYGRTGGLKSFSIRAINEDKDGNIIIATTQGLAYIDTDLEIHTINDPLVNTEYITELVTDSTGRLYGLTLDGAVFEVTDLRISSFYYPSDFGDRFVNSLYAPGPEGVLYCGTTESDILFVTVGQSLEITQIHSTGNLKNINSMLYSGDLLFITATNGAGYLDENLSFVQLSDIPMNNSIGSVVLDAEGNIWMTSTRQGVLKIVPDRFTDLSSLAGLESVVINSTCLNSDESLLYLGTDRGLIIIGTADHTVVTNELTDYLEAVRIRCVYKDDADNIWFCTHGATGLVCLRPSGEIISINEENGLDANKVRTCTQLSDGTLAVATGNGLYIIKDFRVTAHYGSDNGIYTTEILSVAQDYNGTLYLGSDGDGIYVIKNNMVSRFGLDDGLTSGVVMRIKRDDKRGYFWLITSNSIQYMNIETGEINTVTNFPYSNNYDIYFSDNDDVWVLASSGIYVTTVEDILSGGELEYSFYNVKSGLPYIATGNSRNVLTEDGRLYISGTTGVCMVNINAKASSNTSVKLAIPSVEIDDRTVPAGDGAQISLPAGSRRLVINAYALTFGLSNPRVSYYLEGFEKEPILTTKQDLTSIVYTNLDGGTYTFHINVIDDETGQISRTASITVIKESSLYESIFFWIELMLIAMVIVIVVMWQIFKRRNDALLEKQEEDRQFITQIMHTFAKCIDMRDTMNQGHSFRVAYYTRLLAQKLAEKRHYSDDQINEFYNIALLHDIGKISIPDAVLNKPERLNDEEYEIIKSHAAKGEELLSTVDIVENLAVGAGCHHERLDGRGYPHGLKGDEIPETARIIAVADTFDAMYSTRPYRRQMPLEDVLNEIRRVSGTQLDSDVVDALCALAAENKLDKAAVDEYVKEVKTAKKKKKKKAPELSGEELERKRREFNESLGLTSSSKAEQDRDPLSGTKEEE